MLLKLFVGRELGAIPEIERIHNSRHLLLRLRNISEQILYVGKQRVHIFKLPHNAIIARIHLRRLLCQLRRPLKELHHVLIWRDPHFMESSIAVVKAHEWSLFIFPFLFNYIIYIHFLIINISNLATNGAREHFTIFSTSLSLTFFLLAESIMVLS